MTTSADKNRLIPLVITCLIIITVAIIPLKIIKWGYMPKDDATRHAAKVVSGKDWNQILVIRDDIRMDNHPGWHAILGIVHKALGFNTYQLVIFSVFALFFLFSLIPTFLLKRPEAWVLTLLAIILVEPARISRLLLGRPYMVTMAAIMIIAFLWRGLAGKKIRFRDFFIMALSIAMATWIHGGWYFFILPIAAFFLAREFRAGIRLTAASAAGIIAGASLTGHPVMFLTQSLKHAMLAFSNYKLPGVLVTEFQPFTGDTPIVIAVILMLMWRAVRGEWNRKAIDNPVAILALISWGLGFITARVWVDIGMAATLLWMAQEFQEFLVKRMPLQSQMRFLTAAVVSAILFVAVTNDAGSRWSQNRPMPYITFDKPETASWAPGKGGIVYNSDMAIFYNMFYKNPNAPWRYILGFEPGIMPPEDLAIYRHIQLEFGPASFAPWVKKMRPIDRLIIFEPSDKEPQIKELEWYHAGDFIWIGRRFPR